MNPISEPNFLLRTKTAQYLFHRYAEHLPIYDYHCHLSAEEILNDKHFKNLTELWLSGDHYKWRLMRTMGIEEDHITGSAPDYEKFLSYVKCVQSAIGNPLYHWSHLELKQYFGLDTVICEENAEQIWNEANKEITSPDFSARNLLLRSKVSCLSTTNDPCDDLSAHREIKESGFSVRVVPAFRPDRFLLIEKEDFPCEYDSFQDLCRFLSERMAVFSANGCITSDHGLTPFSFVPPNQEIAESVYQKRQQQKPLSQEEIVQYQSTLLCFLGKEYAKRNWVMQLHLGAVRNNNTAAFRILGKDRGFDSIGDSQSVTPVSRFLDALEQEKSLPKTILYSLNPNDNDALSAMAGNFTEPGVSGKVQLGAAWWMNDHKDGILEQLKAVSRQGALSSFVGMLTDSRSFLSYSRHHYFRRILCNYIGDLVEQGEFPYHEAILSDLIEKICYDNAVNYFEGEE